MKLPIITVLSLFGATLANAVAQPNSPEAPQLDARDEHHANDLFKRKGGGGGGGRSGGGGSSGGKSSSGSSSGSSSRGSGTSRGFGGGKFYGGGASKPYKSGSKSPSGLVPLALGAGVGYLAFAAWSHGPYLYPYSHPYRFRNDTTNNEEELPVICGCDQYSPCGCDETDDTANLDELVGSGAYSQLNKSAITVAQVNGTKTILIDGTLSNDTTAPSDNAAVGLRSGLEFVGFLPIVVMVAGAVFMA